MPKAGKAGTPKRAATRKNGADAVPPIATLVTVTRDDIARLAYEIYEQEGAPHGRDLEHWLSAERRLAARA